MASNILTSKKYTIATGIWLIALLVASLFPAPAKIEPFHLFEGEDKLIHVIMYAGLTFLALAAIQIEKLAGSKSFVAIILAGVVAISTEWLQLYIPGRSMSFWDLLANSVGIATGYVFYRFFKAKLIR